MSAFGSRLAGAGFGAGTALAGDAAFAAPVLFAPVFAEEAFAEDAFAEEAFAAEAFVREVFAGAAFAAGLVTLLAAAAAFAAGAFTAGFAAVFAAAVLAVAFPCTSVPAAGFETALADAFTGVFDAFATRSSLGIPVRLFLGRPCRAASKLMETSSAAASLSIPACLSMYCLYRRRCKSCPSGKPPKDLPSKIFPQGNLWNGPWIGWKRPRHRYRQTADQ
ncbi:MULTISPECIES: hypothetical protein [Mesorhizobium]|uniref:hypothetical protein n=1 Tax=Mesorhizobium TaxID=68287 RepID=UPI001FDAC383|nr:MULTISPECIES: hypothetical protein [Mesorhizobium]WJI42174.1 hypothetical protein NL534_29780 [Mesorhizobium opportunistum]